jgi:peptidyl-prolyl cis-trans isomerase-like protein 2
VLTTATPQGNVFDMASLQLLAIKPKTFRDLVNEEPFTRKDIITIQDPENLAARDLREYDYVKSDKKVEGGGMDCRRA